MEPMLLASPADAAVLEAASSAAVLIGGYDGSPNFGDVLQGRAAVRLHRSLAAHPVAIVLEAEFLDEAASLGVVEPGVAVLACTTDGAVREGLVPVRGLPRHLLVHLYGGGYVNHLWGERKLAQLDAVVAAAGGWSGAAVRLVASGLQVSPHTGLDRWRTVLARAEFVSTRDPASRDLLVEGSPAIPSVQLTGDDALPELVEWVAASKPLPEAPSAINVHLSPERYVTIDPERRRDAVVDLVAALARHIGSPLHCRTLVAYSTDRIGERLEARRLEERYRERAVGEGLPEVAFENVELVDHLAAGEVVHARATISSSYHVALLSAVMGAPTLLLFDNPYYEQKAAGLRDLAGVLTSPIGGLDAPRTAEALLAHETAARDRSRDLAAQALRGALTVETAVARASLAVTVDRSSTELQAVRAEYADAVPRLAELQIRHEDTLAAVERLRHRLAELEGREAQLDAELCALRQTRTFRYTNGFRRLYGGLRRRAGRLRRAVRGAASGPPAPRSPA